MSVISQYVKENRYDNDLIDQSPIDTNNEDNRSGTVQHIGVKDSLETACRQGVATATDKKPYTD